MRFQSLDDWLRWQETCHPSAIDLGLERVQQVAAQLGLLKPQAKIVTIAGTNGKGSCAAAVEALLKSEGKACGVYTSPHILHYRERIKIAGQFATDQALCNAFAAIDAARGDISLTYFEFGTLAAFYIFAQHELPYWILEVGMGGRLDATNVLDPEVAVITSIALDHMEWLGSDREAIGREKAGICRAGVPLVCADPHPPQSVLALATDLACPVYQMNRDFGFNGDGEKVEFWVGLEKVSIATVNLPKPSLAAALQVMQLLSFSGLPVKPLENLRLPGRLQRFKVAGREVLVDVAHNPAAMAHLAASLHGQRFELVIAMMADKNLPESFAALAPIINAWHLTTIADLPRAASVQQLELALPTGAAASTYASVAQALDAILAGREELPVLVTGSFYTVAEATRYLQQRGAES